MSDEVIREIKKEVSMNIVNWQRANLMGADLQGANLRGANMRGANLRGANLRGADLWRADLWEANLQGANLWEANLQGANLRGANLREANLREANLQGARISDSTIKNFKEISCIGTSRRQLRCFFLDNGKFFFTTGCFSGSEEELRNKVLEKYGAECEYLEAMDFLKRLCEKY